MTPALPAQVNPLMPVQKQEAGHPVLYGTWEETKRTIAFVSDRAFPYFKGGAERRYWEVAKRLVQFGHTVHFFTGQWPGMPKESVVDGITLYVTYRVRRFYVGGRKSIKESVIYTLSLLPYLLSAQYDLIECEQFPLLSMFPAKIASLIRRKPLVATWHEVWGNDAWVQYLGQKGRVGAWVEQLAAKLPDHIISVSQHTTDRLNDKFGIERAKISTIPNGVHLSHIGGAENLSEQSDIIFVGRLIDHKRLDELLGAVALVKQRQPNIRCIIVGDGPQRASLEQLSLVLNIKENVEFLGFIDDDLHVHSLLRSSKVFVSPSQREGFGIAVVEANACGIPAVVVDHQDNASRDLIIPGYNGFVTECKASALAEKIQRILDEPAKRYQFSCRAAASRFDWDKIAGQIGSLYQSSPAAGTKGDPVVLSPTISTLDQRADDSLPQHRAGLF